MMFQMNLRTLGWGVAAFFMTWSMQVDAQSYRGRRAGSVTARGSVANCNMAGSVFMEVGRNFNMVNGGRCILNGSRFENSEPAGDMGPIVPLDGLDLRHSQWVAVDFLTPPSLRYTNASQANFSAIHMDGEPVEMVDATGFIATKTKFHGAQMASWYVQGASFDEADFSSAMLMAWTTDGMSYEGLYELAPEGMRAISAESARFENCVLEECNLSGGNFEDATFLLTKFTEECIFNGANFTNAMFDQTDFLEASLSGSNMNDSRIDQSSFEDCNLTGAQLGSAMIRNTSFKGANMRGVSFDRAMVDGADFTGTDLSTCNLTGAVMKKLVGTPPPLPQDFVVKSYQDEDVDANGDTLRTDVYDIVINENRYNDGLREKD
mgnify:FL=1|tara:strand:- start:776 stop:1909 length:1134 start_codon:yes stop_codon:yes gene_type:complete